jgi:carbonic anhydrase/acetyltransferase-like protein (isoleucine patch superfamily)
VTDIPAGWHRHPNGGGLVQNTAWVENSAYIGPDAWVFENAQVFSNARVSGTAEVSGHARVYGNARVHGDARVYGNALVLGNALVSGDAWVCGNAHVYGNARVHGTARVHGDALIVSSRHVLTIGPIGSENQTITVWREETGHGLSVGCWKNHNIDELADEVQRRAPEHAAEYAIAEALIRSRIKEWEEARRD